MAAVELATGYVTLTVETADLGKQIGQMFSGVEVTASKSGRKMGEQMAKAFEQSKPDVDKLEADFKKAQEKIVRHKEVGSRKIEAADRKVEIQQARVNEMLQKYGNESSQYLRANDQLITAKQKAEAETMAYESALEKLESQLGTTQGALEEAQKATEDTGDSAAGAADKYAKGWRGVGQRLRDTLTHGVQGASDDAATAAEAGGDKAGTFWSRAMETAVGVGLYKVGETIVTKIGGFVGNAFTSGWDRLTSIDEASAKLRGFGNDAQTVEQIMENATNSVTGTAFGLESAATTAAGAVAAQIKPGQQLEGHLTNIANNAAAAGSSMEEMGSIFNKAATQANGVQNDVIGQLSDKGIPIYQELADIMGVTAGEVFKLASEGKVDFETFSQAAEAAAGNVADEMGKTFTGSVSLVTSSLGRMGANLWSGIFEMAAPALQALQGWLKGLEPIAEDVGQKLGDSLSSAAAWISENTDLLGTIAQVAGVAAAGFGAYFAITKTIATYTALRTWLLNTTLAQQGLNAAMRANPIGLVVTAITALVAGFIWAYREIGWFKDGVNAVLDALGTGWNWLYENAISPAIDGIVAGWTWLSDTFTAAWESHLSPVFSAIGTVFTWLWQNIISPYIGFMVGLFLSFGEVISWVWTNVLSHVFNAIGAVVVWLWQNVVSPYIGFIGAYWSAIFMGMGWAWDNILAPVFTGIGIAAVWLWQNVLSPTFAWIGENWSTVMDIMAWAWNFVLKPAWDGLVLVLSWMWNSVLLPTFTWIGEKWDNILKGMELVWVNVLQPAFQKIGDTVLDLWGKFETGVDNIKKVWDTLQGIAAKPIKFVIEKVINDGLISGFNSLIGLIPFMDLEVSPVPIPSWMEGYYDGGWTGPGSKYDPAGLVHADEFVVQKASRRTFERENPGLLDHINRHGTFAGYADGGLVQPVRGKFTSGFGASRGRYPHAGVDWAVPIGTPVLAALAGTALGHQPAGRTGRYVFLAHPGNRNTYYGHLSQPMVSPGDQVAQGQVIGLSGNTGNSTGPHLHFETWVGGKPVDPMKYMGGLPTSESGGEGWFDPLAPLRALGEKIGGWFTEKFPAGGFLVDAAKQTATGAIDGVIDWLTDVIPFMGDPDDGASSNAHGAASGLIQQQVKDVAAKYGWSTGAQWNAIDAIATKESGWRLNAKNPNSSAEGIFQQMTSIHGPVASSATGQAEWFMKYIGDRYGTPTNALAFHNRNNWYADGGLVQPTIGALTRDSGGVVPPGSSVINNYTRDPEWMYTNKQQDTVQDALDIVKNGAGKQLHVHLNGDGVTVGDVFRKFEFEERREARV